MADSFGTRLRQRREERQIDLIAISERTKIKITLLEGLEVDDVSQWPSGIFRRAYIRAYAQMVGLDPDQTLREFLKIHPDPRDVSVMTAAGAAAAEEEYSKTAGLRLRTIVDSAIASLSRRHRPVAITQMKSSTPDLSSSSLDELPSTAPADVAGAASAAVQTPIGETDETPAAHQQSSSSVPVPQAASTTDTTADETIDKTTDNTTENEDATAAAIAEDVQATNDAKLESIARLCTELGRVVDRDALQNLLEDCAATLGASGLIVWIWDDVADALRPALVYGYSDKVLARVPAVSRDADNATAEAFRTSAPCEVAPSTWASGALVVPMLTADGCTGVFAIELHQSTGLTSLLRATATTVAAALTQVIVRSRSSAPAPREPLANQFRSPAR